MLEAVVDFEAELSVVGVRSHTGACAFFAPSANEHVNGILDVSVAPSPFSTEVTQESTAITRGPGGRPSGVMGTLAPRARVSSVMESAPSREPLAPAPALHAPL